LGFVLRQKGCFDNWVREEEGSMLGVGAEKERGRGLVEGERWRGGRLGLEDSMSVLVDGKDGVVVDQRQGNVLGLD